MGNTVTIDDFEATLKSKKRDRNNLEGMELGGVIFPMIKMKKIIVYLWGAGNDVEQIIHYFRAFEIDIFQIIDIDKEKQGKYIEGIKIVDPEDVLINTPDAICIINTFSFLGMEQFRMVDIMHRLGFKSFYQITEYERAQIIAESYHWCDCNRYRYYREHEDNLIHTFQMLYDNESKKILNEYIRVYIENGTYSLEVCDGRIKYFGGLTQNGGFEDIYEKGEEVWLNCGSNIGDNIFWFFADGFEAKKIYAYEADKNTYRKLSQNIDLLDKEFREKVVLKNEFLGMDTDFSEISEKVTLINADIEGHELELLKALKELIINDRPVLAICVYHRASDLVDIPRTLESYVDGYAYILRKYEGSIGAINRAAELVLYAVPEERVSNNILSID